MSVSPLVLEVDELPAEGRPPGFAGLLGPVTLSASVAPAGVALGGSLHLSVIVQGDTNLWNMPSPRESLAQLAGPRGLRAAGASSRATPAAALVLRRYFSFDLVPRRAGVLAAPRRSGFPTSTPRRGRYEEATAALPALRVAEARARAPAPGEPVPRAPPRHGSRPAARGACSPSALVAAALALAAAALAQRRRRRPATRSPGASQRRAAAAARGDGDAAARAGAQALRLALPRRAGGRGRARQARRRRAGGRRGRLAAGARARPLRGGGAAPPELAEVERPSRARGSGAPAGARLPRPCRTSATSRSSSSIPAETPWRKLAGDFVATAILRGPAHPEGRLPRPSCASPPRRCATSPTSSAPATWRSSRKILDDPEASDNDRFVALEMLKNANVSAGMVLPSCQDTGTAIVIGHKGQHVFTSGDDDEALSRGIYETYTSTSLRYSQLAPLTMYEEKNTGTNLPAQIEIYAEPGDEYEFLFVTKGGGSANKTFLFQETRALLNPDSLLEVPRREDPHPRHRRLPALPPRRRRSAARRRSSR